MVQSTECKCHTDSQIRSAACRAIIFALAVQKIRSVLCLLASLASLLLCTACRQRRLHDFVHQQPCKVHTDRKIHQTECSHLAQCHSNTSPAPLVLLGCPQWPAIWHARTSAASDEMVWLDQCALQTTIRHKGAK